MIEILMSGRIPPCVSRADLTRAIRRTVARVRPSERGSLSLTFLSESRMRYLNRTWRGIDRSTDVLSFAPASLSLSRKAAPPLLGDLYIAPAFVRRDAIIRRVDVRGQLLRVTIHGALHLFGYDHASPSEERRMFGLQERILQECV